MRESGRSLCVKTFVQTSPLNAQKKKLEATTCFVTLSRSYDKRAFVARDRRDGRGEMEIQF